MKAKLEKIHHRPNELLLNIIDQTEKGRNDVRGEKDEVIISFEDNSNEGYKFSKVDVKFMNWYVVKFIIR